MGRYVLKRIIYSIFSLVCIMIIMVILLFVAANRSNVLGANRDRLARLDENERQEVTDTIYEEYGFLTKVNFQDYIYNTYSSSLDEYDYEEAIKIPEKKENNNDYKYVLEFINKYESMGYKITQLDAIYKRGEKQASQYLYATKDVNVFERVWDFFSNLISIETVNDVDKETLENYQIERGYYVVENNIYGDVSDKASETFKYWSAFDYQMESYEQGIYSFEISVTDEKLEIDDSFNIAFYEGGNVKKLFDEDIVFSGGAGNYYIDLYVTKEDGIITYDYDLTRSGDVVNSNIFVKKDSYLVQNKGISLIWDEYSNMPALVGNGTTHKYLIYFDDQFPFIHQNIIHINIGSDLNNTSVYDQMFKNRQAATSTESYIRRDLVYPAYLNMDESERPSSAIAKQTPYDFHTLTYVYGSSSYSEETGSDFVNFGGRYSYATFYTPGMTRVGYSFTIGIFATLIAYVLGIPLGILMARKKDTWVDKLGTAYIVFLIAVPSLSYLYMFRSLGGDLLHLPTSLTSGGPEILLYLLPIFSLALPSIAGEMKWTRRYMIDQMNSDYAKFAKSQGLSDGQIFTKHIAKNAIIPIVHGIPGAIIGCISGSLITEKIYSIPGTGKMLTEAINKSDNGIILGLTFLFSFLSIVALILGDILMAVVDPRIQFSSGGGKRKWKKKS